MKIDIYWSRFMRAFYENFKDKKFIPNFGGEFTLDNKKYRLIFKVTEGSNPLGSPPDIKKGCEKEDIPMFYGSAFYHVKCGEKNPIGGQILLCPKCSGESK